MTINIKGYDVLIDDDDYGKVVSGYTWQTQKCKNQVYFYRWLPRNKQPKKREYLHRIICGDIDGLVVDHIDGNTRNNKKSNLRNVTRLQNAMNKAGYGKLGYKGVSYFKKGNLYRARIRINGKQKTLGYRKTVSEAYELYCEYAIKYFGEYARL